MLGAGAAHFREVTGFESAGAICLSPEPLSTSLGEPWVDKAGNACSLSRPIAKFRIDPFSPHRARYAGMGKAAPGGKVLSEFYLSQVSVKNLHSVPLVSFFPKAGLSRTKKKSRIYKTINRPKKSVYSHLKSFGFRYKKAFPPFH